MENLILIVHLSVALAIIGLILLQQGKGAEMGASFGAGASQTLFGSSGSGNFFSRLTAILAAVFFTTSFTLAIVAKNRTGSVDDLPLPEALEVQEAGARVSEEGSPMDDVPLVDEVPQAEPGVDDVPRVESKDDSDSGDIPSTNQSGGSSDS